MSAWRNTSVLEMAGEGEEANCLAASLYLLGSPMLVDTSFQSQPEDHMEDAITLTVAEYAEDIHQYLRDAEVSGLQLAYRYLWSLMGCNTAKMYGCPRITQGCH